MDAPTRGPQTVVSAAVSQVFVQPVQPDRKAAGEVWRHVANQLRTRFPKAAALLDNAEHDVLACMDYPEAHRTKLRSTNPLERLNKEVKGRTDVVGIFPNEGSVRRLVGAILLEQNDDWLLQQRYVTLEIMAGITASDDARHHTAPLDKGGLTDDAHDHLPITTTLTDVTGKISIPLSPFHYLGYLINRVAILLSGKEPCRVSEKASTAMLCVVNSLCVPEGL